MSPTPIVAPSRLRTQRHCRIELARYPWRGTSPMPGRQASFDASSRNTIHPLPPSQPRPPTQHAHGAQSPLGEAGWVPN